MDRYTRYSAQLKARYGEKVYKIPIQLPVTCPNRDGRLGTGGCTFCGIQGAGFEAQPVAMQPEMQLRRNMAYMGPKYGAKRFIAYFQNYTNTYLEIAAFRRALEAVCVPEVVGLSISTRPDCVGAAYLDAVSEVAERFGVDVEFELGLQSINVNTLRRINRGHGLAVYIDAVRRIQNRGFQVCTHLIGNLPWDTEDDVLEAARLMTVLEMDSVKVHSLYILKGTEMGRAYAAGEFELISAEAYMDRMIHFLRLLDKGIGVQRLFGRAPESETLFCNWQTSWRKLHNRLEALMAERNVFQGDLCGGDIDENDQRVEGDIAPLRAGCGGA